MEQSKQNILNLNGKHNYMLEAETRYNKVIERFDTKNKEYFDALRELRDQYNKEFDVIEVKANQLIYGNPEGKIDRKYRDRSDLYLKVVKRNQKYKNWDNFFMAIGAAAVFILLARGILWPFNFCSHSIGNGFENIIHIVLLNMAWSGLFFNCSFFFKSLKYFTVSPSNTKEEKKWLEKYFKNIRDIINAKAYLEVLVQREENIEKYLDCAERAISRDEDWQKLVNAKSEVNETYRKAIDTKSDIISKMKKDIEKVMDDFIYDAGINNALDHVLESWKNY